MQHDRPIAQSWLTRRLFRPTHTRTAQSQRPLLVRVRVAIVEAGQLVAMVANSGRGLLITDAEVYGEYTRVYGNIRIKLWRSITREGTVAVWLLCLLVFETCREASLCLGEEFLLLVGKGRTV